MHVTSPLDRQKKLLLYNQVTRLCDNQVSWEQWAFNCPLMRLQCIICTCSQGDELSSSELLSWRILYLFSTGSDAVAGILNDLAEPTTV